MFMHLFGADRFMHILDADIFMHILGTDILMYILDADMFMHTLGVDRFMHIVDDHNHGHHAVNVVNTMVVTMILTPCLDQLQNVLI